MNIPKDHQVIMPYLIVKEADKFLDFIKQVFNAKELSVNKAESDVIVNAQFMIGDSTIMFSESRKPWPVENAGLFIYVANADETFQEALKNGAEVVADLENHDYGRSGGVRDPFGNTWWITQAEE